MADHDSAAIAPFMPTAEAASEPESANIGPVQKEDRWKAFLESVVAHAPQSVEEARRVLRDLNLESLRWQSRKMQIDSTPGPDYMVPVRASLSKIFGHQFFSSYQRTTRGFRRILSDRFRSYKAETSEEQFLAILPFQLTQDLIKDIFDLSMRCKTNMSEGGEPGITMLERFLGGVGIGKSHAAFIVLLAAIGLWDHAYFCVIMDPWEAITNPQMLIVQLLYTLHRIDTSVLLEALLPLYIKAKFCTERARLLVEILVACRNLCNDKDIPFICIIDQENALYRQENAPDASYLTGMLTSNVVADMVIFISSATNPGVRYANSQVSNHNVRFEPSLQWKSASSFLHLMLGTPLMNDTQKANLHRWVEYFGGLELFLDGVEDRSRGCYLEIVKIIEYFSYETPGQADPWEPYFVTREGQRLADKHTTYMADRMSSNSYKWYMKNAYFLLMTLLDFHLHASEEEVVAAGKWLWQSLSHITGTYEHNELLNLLENHIDGRFMTIAVNETPKAISERASLILRSLPKGFYFDSVFAGNLTGERPNGPESFSSLMDRLPATKGFLLEDRIFRILYHRTEFQIQFSRRHAKDDGDDYADAMALQRIRPSIVMIISVSRIKQQLDSVFRHVKQNLRQWIHMIPSDPFFPLIDFATLLLPGNDDPPVLFVIQVTTTIMTHKGSDLNFRNGYVKNRQYYIHPLLEAFSSVTGELGRVQFIWVGQEEEDISKAATDKDFDPRSWFTSAEHWSPIEPKYESSTGSVFRAVSFSKVGYSSGEALLRARELATQFNNQTSSKNEDSEKDLSGNTNRSKNTNQRQNAESSTKKPAKQGQGGKALQRARKVVPQSTNQRRANNEESEKDLSGNDDQVQIGEPQTKIPAKTGRSRRSTTNRKT